MPDMAHAELAALFEQSSFCIFHKHFVRKRRQTLQEYQEIDLASLTIQLHKFQQSYRCTTFKEAVE